MDLDASRQLIRNPALRALMLAWAAFYIGDFAHFALVVAFTFTVGGAPAVGAAIVLNVLPGGLLGPLAATLATSRRPQRHLAIGIGARVVTMAATIVAVLTGAPVGVVLALVGVDSLVSATVRPLHGGLSVRLANTTTEAAAANALTSFLVSTGALAGPALGGLALGLVGIGWGFVLPMAIFAAGTVSALLIAIPGAEDPPAKSGSPPSGGFVRSQFEAVAAGFRGIVESRPAAAATALLLITMMQVGIWDGVTASLANDRLALGSGGVATIMTIYGLGGLVAALATLSIVGRRGLAVVLAGTMLGMAALLAVIATLRLPVPVLALASGVGAATAAACAIAPTLVQRSVSRTAMVAAAATLQSMYLIGMAAGAAIAPVLLGWFGVPGALVVLSVAVALTTLLSWPQLRRADALSTEDSAKLAVIRATPMLAPLPALALEQLARAATRLTVPAGSEVIRQGDPGDRFYMIAAGAADVAVDGRRVATLGPGGSFGEIAMLHDVPRSATVTARTELELVAVDREEFLSALSSDAGSTGHIGGFIQARLTTPPVTERLTELDRAEAALEAHWVAELLATQPPLANIGGDALHELAGAARVMAAPDGALIIREGDYGDTYYVILEGAAEVFEGESSVRSLRPGDGFGERAILREVPATASVRAAGDTTLVAVDRQAFQQARRVG